MPATFAQIPALTVHTDKKSYVKGDTIIVSGRVEAVVAGTPITIQILDSTYNIVNLTTTYPAANGTFSFNVTTMDPKWKACGTYTAIMQYGLSQVGARTTFYFCDSVPAPLKQLKSGIPANEIKCNQGLVLIIKTSDNSPACVKPQTAQKLINRGWGSILYHSVLWSCPPSMLKSVTCYLIAQSDHTSLTQSIGQLEGNMTFPLIIATDKSTYKVGEQVIIEIKNVSKEPLWFGSNVKIFISGPLPRHDPTSCCAGLTIISSLPPNETNTTSWDQLDQYSKPVKEGFYEIDSLYWSGDPVNPKDYFGASTLIHIVK